MNSIEDLQKLFDETSGNEVDLSSYEINKEKLSNVKKLVKENAKITSVKFNENFLHEDDESRKVFERIQKYLKENETLSQVEKIINENNIETDLSHFDINKRLLELVEKRVQMQPNIGLIKWKEMKMISSEDDEIKSLMEKVERRLIDNFENFRRYPSDYVHCLLANQVYKPVSYTHLTLPTNREV